MAVLAWAQLGLALGKWPILTNGHTQQGSLACSVHVTTGCSQPRVASGARYIPSPAPAPARSKHCDLIDILNDPLCLSLFKRSTNSAATGANVTSIQWSTRNESEHARYMQRVSSIACLYSDLFCSWVPGMREWSNSRLGKCFGPPGWAPSPVFWHVERLNYRRQTHKLFTQPSSSHQHC